MSKRLMTNWPGAAMFLLESCLIYAAFAQRLGMREGKAQRAEAAA